MKLTDSELQHLHSLALAAARRAGDHVQGMVGRIREIQDKQAGDTPASQVVTEVDFEAQRLILEMLRESIDEFRLGLLTEESVDDSSRHETDYFWCIDPLDGTLPFTQRTPGYSVAIALVSRAGAPQLGVIHDPAAKYIFHAVMGCGAFLNGEPIQSRPISERMPLTWIMDQSMKSLEHYPVLSDSIERLAQDHAGLNFVDHAGAALNACWVTQYAPAVYFKLPKKSKGGGSLWDFAASACLIDEWGVPATDIFGRPLDLNRADDTFMNESGVIYASHPRLGEAVQRIHHGLVAEKRV